MRKGLAGQPESMRGDSTLIPLPRFGAGEGSVSLTPVLHLLQLLRHLAGPAELVLDAPAQAIGGGWLAMDDVGHARRRLEALQPAQDLAGIGMGGEHGEVRDLGAQRHFAAMDLDALDTGQHGGTPRPHRLIAREEDRVAGVGGVALQVMQHAPAGGHAAGRDDDLGHGIGGQRLGFLGAADIAGDRAQRMALGIGELVVAGMTAQQLRGVDGHGAVEEDPETLQPAFFLQLLDMEQQRLRPADGKGRNDDGAAARRGALDDLAPGPPRDRPACGCDRHRWIPPRR